MYPARLATCDSHILFWKAEVQFCPAWMKKKKNSRLCLQDILIWEKTSGSYIKRFLFPFLVQCIWHLFLHPKDYRKRDTGYVMREKLKLAKQVFGAQKDLFTKPGSMIPESCSSVYNLPCGPLSQKLRLAAKSHQLLQNAALPVQPGGLTALSSSNAAIYSFPCLQWLPFSALLKQFPLANAKECVIRPVTHSWTQWSRYGNPPALAEKKKKSSSETQKLLLPSFLSKCCEFQIQRKAKNREHGGNILLLCCLKGKQQLARYAKATNSQWNWMLLKTHIAAGQMVGLCSVLHWGERFTVQQGLQDDLASAELVSRKSVSPSLTTCGYHLPFHRRWYWLH